MGGRDIPWDNIGVKPIRSGVPNKPKTPIRAVRISDEVWDALRLAAEKNGETAADVLRRAAESYVRRNR